MECSPGGELPLFVLYSPFTQLFYVILTLVYDCLFWDQSALISSLFFFGYLRLTSFKLLNHLVTYLKTSSLSHALIAMNPAGSISCIFPFRIQLSATGPDLNTKQHLKIDLTDLLCNIPTIIIFKSILINLWISVVMLAKERQGEHKKVDRKTYIFK